VLSAAKQLPLLTGNTFGADRIDYLLRDSRHAGVGYGRFDPDRLIGGLRALIAPNIEEVTLGIDLGAIHAAEALLVGRYFMYTQVYFHDVRRAYDMHLQDFLQGWLPGGKFSTEWRDLLKVSDNEVLAALREAASDPKHRLFPVACPLMKREHYRTVHGQMSTHKRKRPTVFEDLAAFARQEFGDDKVRTDTYGPKSETNDFWVLTDEGSPESSLEVSGMIAQLPPLEFAFLFVAPELKEKARTRIGAKLKELLAE
jgi:HD superfamily phosphohydrolase